jgi:transposase
MRPQGAAVVLENRRRHAVELLNEGVPRKWIAKVLGVSTASLSRWQVLAKSGTLYAKPHLGRSPKLTDDDCQQLRSLLLEGATAYGWANDYWTCARVGQIIKAHFGVDYHPDHVSRILKDRLNWTCQRPGQIHDDRDDAAVTRWVHKTFPKIIQNAAARNAHIAFVDETGFMLAPLVRRTYAPRGQTPTYRVADKHGRISVIGAILVSPGRTHPRLPPLCIPPEIRKVSTGLPEKPHLPLARPGALREAREPFPWV